MIFLAFDFETTGLNDPMPVQLGAVLRDGDAERAAISVLIQPDGWAIGEEATRVHGITQEMALDCGVPLRLAVALLTNLWARAEVRVAHNLEFDDKVYTNALVRLGADSTLRRPPGACTADLATQVMNLPPTAKMLAAGITAPKRPSLAECYQHFFGGDVPDAHDALADARACARIYGRLTE